MVTIIVPTFNRARYLPECLDSLLAQTYEPFEIIVVNDGSTDETASVIQPYLGRIEYIEKENGGKSSALNLVIPRVQSEYIWIFDDDDVALPDALETHIMALESNPDAGFSYSTYYVGLMESDGQIQKGPVATLPDPHQDELFFGLLEGGFVAHPATIVRSRCYREVGPFDSHLMRSQDTDMLLRLSRIFKSIRIDKPTVICRVHGGTRGSAVNRFAVEHQHFEWFKYDKIIFQRLYDELALSEYLPGREKNEPLTHAEKREALLRRMSVMTRKGLWQYATADLEQLSRDRKFQEPLSEFERQQCRKATGNRFANREMLCKRSFLPAVRKFCRGVIGTEMRYSFARGLYYVAVREFGNTNYWLATTALVSIVQILGVTGTVEAMKFKLRLPSKIQ